MNKSEVIFLYYSRLITSDLFKNFLCFNIHPALLPSFKGIDGVHQFVNSGARFLGCTLHLVDEGIDTGQIIAQVSTPVKNQLNENTANKISFLQKVYVSLVGYSLLKDAYLDLAPCYSSVKWKKEVSLSHFANPCLKDQYMLDLFKVLELEENTLIQSPI